MRFVTFQPYDWRTTERYKGYKDIYWDILQFNPTWCIPAESLEQAFINSLITYPVTPEQAIFFKTNKFSIISKVEHYKFLSNDSDRAILLTKGKLQQILKDKSIHKSVSKYLTEIHPYEFEYLVNPNEIEIVTEIDISHVVSQNFNNGLINNKINKLLDEQAHKAKMEFQKMQYNDWHTEERYIRNEIAKTKWYWYIQDNDFFIKDYKKIFGLKNGDHNVTTQNVNSIILDSLVADLDFDASEKKLKEIIDYLKNVIYDKV